MSKWLALGDVNPIEHGGFWIKKDGPDFPGCFYIVQLSHDYDSEKFVIFDGYVDINDSWIEWDSVGDYVGGFEDDYDRARGAFDYYGAENFGGSVNVLKYEPDVIDELKGHGIEI